MAYKKGDRVRVEFTGTVTDQEKVNSTCEVTEASGDGDGFTHYLYLNSDTARDQVLKGGSEYTGFRDPDTGTTIEVAFEAVIDTIGDGPSRTSTVKSDPDGLARQQYYHCVYLDSPSVTPLTGEEAEARAKAVADEAAAKTAAEKAASEKAAAVPSGQPVQARFTATVMSERGPYGTTRVEDAAGVIHYLYLPSGEIGAEGKLPGTGEVITVSLDGTVKTAANGYAKDTPVAGGVFVQSVKGWNHCLNVTSPFVTLPAEAGEESAEPPGGYPEGQGLRVEFEAVVLATEGEEAGTGKVREANGCVHYLFLRREESRRQLGLTGSAPVAGDTIRVAFTTKAEAQGKQGSGPDSTTPAYTRGSAGLWLHYLFLGSPSVKPVSSEEVKEEEREKPVEYKEGDELRAEFTAVVKDVRNGPFSCDTLEEDGNGTVHYLYLEDADARQGVLDGDPAQRPARGDRVVVALTGKVSGYGGQRNGTRGVATPKKAAGRGEWNHALNLSSPSVRPLAARELPLFTKDSKSITSPAVVERIAELRGLAGYTVTRNRTGSVVFRATSEDACTAWLTGEDYNPERFTVAGRNLSLAQAEEARALAALLDEAGTQLGTTWALYDAAYFTADWARAEARELLTGDGYTGLDAWPLSTIDWKAAAIVRRDADYLAFRFAGADFYGKRP